MSLPPIDLAVFHENGYVRKQCRVFSTGFGRPARQDVRCYRRGRYTFIGAPYLWF